MENQKHLENTTATTLASDEWTLGIVKICLFSTFFVLGLIGNSLVLIGIGLNKGMQTTTNLLIFNLALADVLFIIVCIPTTLFSFFGRWPFTIVGCKLGKTNRLDSIVVIISFVDSSSIHQSFVSIHEYLSACIYVDRPLCCCCSCHRFVLELSNNKKYDRIHSVSENLSLFILNVNDRLLF
jgi:hypothetical protein